MAEKDEDTDLAQESIEMVNPDEGFAKEHLALILESLPVVTFVLEYPADQTPADSYPIYISKNVEQVAGYPASYFIRNKKSWLQNIHPDDIEDVLKHQQDVSRENIVKKYRWKIADGSYCWFRDALREVETAVIDKKYLTGIWEDVTVQETAKEQIKLHQDKLAHYSRVSVMGEMATTMAHELNQPLSAIVTYTQGLLRQQSESTEQFKDIIGKVNQQALRAAKIITHLRSYSRKKYSGLSLVDLPEILSTTLELLDSEISTCRAMVNINMPEKLPRIIIGEMQLEQVFVNIIKNALEAGVVSEDQTIIEISIVENKSGHKNTGCIDISIANNGPALDPDIAAKVFEPYFTTKEEGMGMGLGLSICRSTIESFGGRLNYNDHHPLGPCFEICLPVEMDSNSEF